MTNERTVFAYVWRHPSDPAVILRQLHAHDWGIGYDEQRTITHSWNGLNFVMRVPDDVTDEDAIQSTIEAYQLDSDGLPDLLAAGEGES